MQSPNLFIVGAPKCGTTALFSYFAQHPDVFCPARKEFHHFCPDLGYHYRVSDRDAYVGFFKDWHREKWACDASIWYLYSSDAAWRIKSARPEAHIIIMLRHPVDMLVSLHQQYVMSGYEQFACFARALEAQERRAQGIDPPLKSIVPGGLIYKDACRYTAQIRRYLDRFGRDNVSILIYDEFFSHPDVAFSELCGRLGIDAAQPIKFDPVKVRQEYLSNALAGVLRRPGPVARALGSLVPARVRAGVRQRALAAMRIHRRPRVPGSVLRALNEEFLPELDRLSALLDRDLSAWRARYL